MADPAPSKKTEIQVPIHDPVPTLFADGLHGASSIAGCIRLDLFVERAWPGTNKPQPMIVGRLVVPTSRLEMLATELNELVAKLKTQPKQNDGTANQLKKSK